MAKDRLFLLPSGFIVNGQREYCPECAEVWGLLHYFPAIKESLEIVYQPFEKPRTDLVLMLGDNNQNCPTLVLNEESPIYHDCEIGNVRGLNFIDNAREIGRYYAQRYGLPMPR